MESASNIGILPGSSSPREDIVRAMHPAVSVPVRVDWLTMMQGKIDNAFRPSRLALVLVASLGFGIALAIMTGGTILGTTAKALAAVMVLRLVVMATASALDRDARRRFTGALIVTSEGLELRRPDGTSEKHPWSWVLSARASDRAVAIRIDARGGRVWLFVSTPRREVLEHLRAAGKLA